MRREWVKQRVRKGKGDRKDREQLRGRRRECGMGLEEGRIGRRDGRSWLVDESGDERFFGI